MHEWSKTTHYAQVGPLRLSWQLDYKGKVTWRVDAALPASQGSAVVDAGEAKNETEARSAALTAAGAFARSILDALEGA